MLEDNFSFKKPRKKIIFFCLNFISPLRCTAVRYVVSMHILSLSFMQICSLRREYSHRPSICVSPIIARGSFSSAGGGTAGSGIATGSGRVGGRNSLGSIIHDQESHDDQSINNLCAQVQDTAELRKIKKVRCFCFFFIVCSPKQMWLLIAVSRTTLSFSHKTDPGSPIAISDKNLVEIRDFFPLFNKNFLSMLTPFSAGTKLLPRLVVPSPLEANRRRIHKFTAR